MDEKIFDDVYNDLKFRAQVDSMLATMYRHNRQSLEDSSLDFEDFKQEMWASLFEESRFTPDRAWCFEAMKHNAINFCRDCKRRHEIAPMLDVENTDDDENMFSDDRDYSSADFPVRPRAFS